MKYKRILLKLSGESLQGDAGYGISPERLHSYAVQIKAVAQSGVQVGIVIGGGNIFRGLQGAKRGFDRVKGDQMGMLATIINSLALQSALVGEGVKCKVLTSIRMEPIGEYYSKDKAVEYLESGAVVIIGGGTSNPYFSTDSASVEGETTLFYLMNCLRKFPNLKITTIARGIGFGDELEYVDEHTITQALMNRREIEH